MDLALTAGRLRALAPSAKPAILDGIVAGQGVLASYGINTPLRLCHFLAQIAHESAGFKTTVEYASGRAYEGRKDLGNTQPGDGIRFKGRGLLQLTGRANYREMGRKLGLPLEAQPEIAADPATSLRIACEYWKSRRLNEIADADSLAEITEDVRAITKKVNGGTNGLADRRRYFERARTIWLDVAPVTTHPTLRRSEDGEATAEMQRLLGIAADGKFGPKTERALIAFQKARGLVADGVCGSRTWATMLSQVAGD